MKLDSLCETVISVDGRFGHVIVFLADFNALTTLQVVNQNNNTLSLPQLSMFSILRQCPNLISFILRNRLREPKDNSNNFPFDHSKLEYLDLSLTEITSRHISYLVTNITQLKVFKLICGSISNTLEPILWMERIGPDTLEYFGNYLAAIETVDFNLKGNFKTNFIEYWPFISRTTVNN